MPCVSIHWPLPIKPLPAGGSESSVVDAEKQHSLVISRGSSPCFPRQGGAQPSTDCICGALDAGHEGPMGVGGQSESGPRRL